ncbi:GFA family protein [Ascidiaceihabitans sp.]|uniref:GFA family protein n=1 Tax=Ascidiaceihabitans sp. TaxID=1872644 RepID=UPI003297F242
MFSTSQHSDAPPLTGRCYCSHTRLSASQKPDVVSYCHCNSCRRLSGAPVAAFAAFAKTTLTITPAPTRANTVTEGVTRWFCPSCGAAVAAAYDYLPGQIYVPVGLWAQVESLEPTTHSHASSALSWLHLKDDMPRHTGSARTTLLGDD